METFLFGDGIYNYPYDVGSEQGSEGKKEVTDHYEPRAEKLPITPGIVLRLLLKLGVAILEKRLTPTSFTREVRSRREDGRIIETSTFTISVEAEIGEVED